MKLIKQPVSLEVKKIIFYEKNREKRHGNLLPNNIRCLICGPSNCGKTNVMLTLLIHENGVRFENIYLYSKTSYQPKYQYLKKILDKIPEAQFFIYNDDEDVIHPDDALPNSIIIFDDVITEKQSNIRNYFTMGRHKGIDCFYLSQTYSKIPKQLIRDNANVLILFKQDDINLKHVYDEHVGSDMQWSKFKTLCSKIFIESYDFLVINKDCDINEGRYRKSFDTFIVFS